MSSYRRRNSYSRAWSKGRYMQPARAGRRPYKKRNVRSAHASRKRLRAIANLRTGGLLGVETKYFDLTVANQSLVNDLAGDTTMDFGYTTALNTYQVINWLNVPGVGSSATQRDGRVIRNSSIEICGVLRYRFSHAASSASALYPRDVVIALCLDTQVNAAATPVEASAIYDRNPDDGSALPLLSTTLVRNMENGNRFRVLALKRHSLAPPTTTIQYGGTDEAILMGDIPFKIYRRLGFKTTFTPGSSTVLDGRIIDNGLFLCAWYSGVTLTGIGGTNFVVLNARSRLRFVG